MRVSRPIIKAGLLGVAMDGTVQTWILIAVYWFEILLIVNVLPEVGPMANFRAGWEALNQGAAAAGPPPHLSPGKKLLGRWG